MPVQIPLKLNFDRDAQRQGHVGYNTDKIYPIDPGSEDNPYGDADDGVPNGDRVKSIFDDSYTNMSAIEIAQKLNVASRTQLGDDFNPDFARGEVDYFYSNRPDRQRALDLKENRNDKSLKFAPNVKPNSETYAYVVPFKSPDSNGGFGNDAEEGTLHRFNKERPFGVLPDSSEFVLKYYSSIPPEQ